MDTRIIVDNIYQKLLKKAYKLYLKGWHMDHDEGEPVCLDEFRTNEFEEIECVEEILDGRDFDLWKDVMAIGDEYDNIKD